MKAEQLLEVPSNTINFLKAAGSIVILCSHYGYLLIYSDQYIPRAEGISQSLQYVFQYGETAVEMFFLLSGFGTAVSGRRKETLQNYILFKLKRWYPTVFLTTVICLAIQCAAALIYGSMVLGLGGYHIFDVFSNFFLVQTGIFSERSMLNVPLWFLTPLLVCYVLYHRISQQSEDIQIISYLTLVFAGGIFIYYGWAYPIANVRIGRGWYSFFLGVILEQVYERKKTIFSLWGKVLLMGVIVCICILTDMGLSGNIYLCAGVVFTLLFVWILETPTVERIFSMNIVKRCYAPICAVSFELFCTHFVLLTMLAFIDKGCHTVSLYDNYLCFFLYIFAAYLIALLVKNVSRPLISTLLIKK